MKNNIKSSTFKKLITLLKGHKLQLILSLIFAIVTVSLTLYVPVLVGEAIDNIIGKNNVNFDKILQILTKIAFLIAITAASQWLMSLFNNKMTYGIVHSIRENAFKKIQKLPLKYIDSHPYGDVVSRVITDVDTMADGLLMGFSQLFTGLITILGTVVLMLSIDWKIALVVVILSPISLFAAKFIASRTHNMFQLQSETRGEQTAFIEEYIGNQKTVQAFNHNDICVEQFKEINARLDKWSLKAVFFSSMVNPTTRVINSVIYAVVCLIGAITAITNPLFTIGSLSCLLSYASQYTKPFNEISGVITELQNALVCAERIFSLIDEPSEPTDENSLEFSLKDGNISMTDVCFSYTQEKKLIENLNLNVKYGQRIAIVGPTGCGKTTLINLLMRFYDVTDGKITIDGTNIKDITRHSLRKSYGMVLQETWLKSATIRENITFGNPNATEEEIIAAAKATHAHSFIKRLPNGYDTVIAEDGGNLSEGQKQLLCITRIMLNVPPMLILDEATSSIDVHTEQHIQRSFSQLMQGRTSFVVAHRLSTIKESDIILVMKDGNIIEQGNHSELLEKRGFYHELYNSQFSK